MPEHWRVALIDSGADAETIALAPGARRFVDTGAGITTAAPSGDASGHGTRIAALLRAQDAPVELLLAQVFDDRRTTTAATLAAAVRWATAARASLIHLSLGLRDDRAVLAEAIAAAADDDVLVVASAPARGPMPYPAAYARVLRASGDARCAPGEISSLDPAHGRFGACPRAAGGAAGASIGAAHFTRFVVRQLAPGNGFEASRDRLAALARFHGPERRAR
ncbi:MAG TPA: S8 family serine peptidase [Steroidobacteraceae bacterium]|nr:S8 family serine peptidase [Steroidobacteraceae bacterium]